MGKFEDRKLELESDIAHFNRIYNLGRNYGGGRGDEANYARRKINDDECSFRNDFGEASCSCRWDNEINGIRIYFKKAK